MAPHEKCPLGLTQNEANFIRDGFSMVRNDIAELRKEVAEQGKGLSFLKAKVTVYASIAAIFVGFFKDYLTK